MHACGVFGGSNLRKHLLLLSALWFELFHQYFVFMYCTSCMRLMISVGNIFNEFVKGFIFLS